MPARCRWKPDADARYALTVRLYFADARRVDADNCVKSLADALQPFVVRDDAQITEWHAYKYHDESEQPRAEVEVVELTRWASCRGACNVAGSTCSSTPIHGGATRRQRFLPALKDGVSALEIG